MDCLLGKFGKAGQFDVAFNPEELLGNLAKWLEEK